MAKSQIAVTLQSRSDDWEDLTELVEALSEYSADDVSNVYTAVQNVAEGLPANLHVEAGQFDEFVAHMAEFRIDVTRSKG